MMPNDRINQLEKHIIIINKRIEAGRYTTKTLEHLTRKQQELEVWKRLAAN